MGGGKTDVEDTVWSSYDVKKPLSTLSLDRTTGLKRLLSSTGDNSNPYLLTDALY